MQQILSLLGQPARFQQRPTIQLLMSGRDAPLDLTLEPDRCRRNRQGAFAGSIGLSHPGKEDGQVPILHLPCAIARQVQIQTLPDVPEGLPSAFGLPGQPFCTLPTRVLLQSSIESVALPGHHRKQRRQRHTGIMRIGTGAANGRRHQHGPAQDRRCIVQRIFIRPFGVVDPLKQRIKDDLTDYEATISALRVNQVRIPLAENVVRPFVGRQRVIVSTRVKGQFVELRQVEVGAYQNVAGRFPEQLDRPSDQVVVLANRCACATYAQRNRAEPFVIVRFHFLLVLENRHRPVPDKIVQPVQRTSDESVSFGPRPPLGEHRFEQTSQEKRLLEIRVVEVEQQVRVMAAVGGPDFVENQGDDVRCLIAVRESWRGLVETVKLVKQETAEFSPGAPGGESFVPTI